MHQKGGVGRIYNRFSSERLSIFILSPIRSVSNELVKKALKNFNT